MSESAGAPPTPEGERLARRWFATIAAGRFDELSDLVHDDVQLVSKVRAGTVVDGRENVARFIQEFIAPNLYEAVTEVFTALDDERVIRDDPVVWAMAFRDGLLLRFVPARSVLEAETMLAAQR